MKTFHGVKLPSSRWHMLQLLSCCCSSFLGTRAECGKYSVLVGHSGARKRQGISALREKLMTVALTKVQEMDPGEFKKKVSPVVIMVGLIISWWWWRWWWWWSSSSLLSSLPSSSSYTFPKSNDSNIKTPKFLLAFLSLVLLNHFYMRKLSNFDLKWRNMGNFFFFLDKARFCFLFL